MTRSFLTKPAAGCPGKQKMPIPMGSGILLIHAGRVKLFSALANGKEINMFWSVSSGPDFHSIAVQVFTTAGGVLKTMLIIADPVVCIRLTALLRCS